MEEKNKKLLNIAGILNIVEGAAICVYNPFAIFGLVVMAIGVFFMGESKKTIEEQERTKVFLLIVAIANIVINIVSSILVFIVWDNLLNYRKSANGINAPPEEEQNPETKKIDLLLKLGVGMVFIAGILFATTTWSFISDILKAVILIILGILFVGLSYLTEKVFKLEKSSYVYWILGMAFFLLTIIGIEFFGIFGPFLTFTGEGKYLAYFIVMASLGALSHITYFKYKKNYLIYITYISYLIATHNVIMQAKPSIIFSLIVLTVMNTITLVVDKKDKTLTEIANLFVFILALLVCANVYSEEMVILKLLSAFLSGATLLYYRLTSKDQSLNILGVIITYVLVSAAITSIDMNIISKTLITFVVLTIYSLFNNLKNNNEILLEVNNVIYTFISLIAYTVLLEEEVLISLIVAVIYLILGAGSKVQTNILKQSSIFNMTLPVVIPLIIFPFINLIGLENDMIFAYGIGISAALYCVGHYVLNNNTEKTRFLAYACIATFISLTASAELEELFISLFPILTSLYITGVFYNHKIKFYVLFPYIFFLISMYIPLVVTNVLDINIIFSTVLMIWLMIMCIILFNSQLIKKVTEIAIIFPILNLLAIQNLNHIFENIAVSILMLYVTFIVVKYMIKKNKCIWAMIGIGLSMLNVIFITNLYYALYIGILGVIVLIIGYNSKTYSKLFRFGIAIIILNIAIQLQALWVKVHFSVYLLIVGLGIIAFVTYKEVKKMKNEEKDK